MGLGDVGHGLAGRVHDPQGAAHLLAENFPQQVKERRMRVGRIQYRGDCPALRRRDREGVGRRIVPAGKTGQSGLGGQHQEMPFLHVGRPRGVEGSGPVLDRPAAIVRQGLSGHELHGLHRVGAEPLQRKAGDCGKLGHRRSALPQSVIMSRPADLCGWQATLT